MTGNNNGNGIRRASASHGPRGAGLADLARNVVVRTRATSGDGLQCLPNAALKCGGLDIQRQLEVRALTAQVPDQLAHPSRNARRIAAYSRLRIFAPQRRCERSVGVAEIDRGNAALRTGDQEPPEG